MRPIQRVIYTGFTLAALASASLPALSWTVWPDVDFEWYARVGKQPVAALDTQVFPAPREGYIWAPARYETVNGRTTWVAGHWIRDDFAERVALQAVADATALGVPVETLYAVASTPRNESNRR